MYDRQFDWLDPRHARLRDMNERTVRSLDEFHGEASLSYVVMCECVLADCTKMVEITFVEYQYVRSNGAWFMVFPGHVPPDGEHPVKRFGQYWIVEPKSPYAVRNGEQ